MQNTKLAFLWSTTVAIGLALGACGGDDGGGDENNDDDTTAGDPTTNDPTTNDPTTNDPTTNDPTTNDPTTNDPTTDTDPSTDTDPTTDTDPSTDTGTTDPDTGTETGTGTGGGEVCAEEPDDDECVLCTKENCCTELETCFADPDCGCVAQCVSDSKNPEPIPAAMMCAEECGADFGAVAIPLTAINTCRMGACAQECG